MLLLLTVSFSLCTNFFLCCLVLEHYYVDVLLDRTNEMTAMIVATTGLSCLKHKRLVKTVKLNIDPPFQLLSCTKFLRVALKLP